MSNPYQDLRAFTGNKNRVPHISPVFREMWDTATLNNKGLSRSQKPKGIGRVPHVRQSVHGPKKPGAAPQTLFLSDPQTSGPDEKYPNKRHKGIRSVTIASALRLSAVPGLRLYDKPLIEEGNIYPAQRNPRPYGCHGSHALYQATTLVGPLRVQPTRALVSA